MPGSAARIKASAGREETERGRIVRIGHPAPQDQDRRHPVADELRIAPAAYLVKNR
jgi:hypothetical protein